VTRVLSGAPAVWAESDAALETMSAVPSRNL
jgi:hypothetical protein